LNLYWMLSMCFDRNKFIKSTPEVNFIKQLCPNFSAKTFKKILITFSAEMSLYQWNRIPAETCSSNWPQAKKSSTSKRRTKPFSLFFTWCQTCRHGGHASHLIDWFSEHQVFLHFTSFFVFLFFFYLFSFLFSSLSSYFSLSFTFIFFLSFFLLYLLLYLYLLSFTFIFSFFFFIFLFFFIFYLYLFFFLLFLLIFLYLFFIFYPYVKRTSWANPTIISCATITTSGLLHLKNMFIFSCKIHFYNHV
jgi:hypothetical protein